MNELCDFCYDMPVDPAFNCLQPFHDEMVPVKCCSKRCLDQHQDHLDTRVRLYVRHLKDASDVIFTSEEYDAILKHNRYLGNTDTHLLSFVNDVPCMLEKLYKDLDTNEVYMTMKEPVYMNGKFLLFEIDYSERIKIIQIKYDFEKDNLNYMGIEFVDRMD